MHSCSGKVLENPENTPAKQFAALLTGLCLFNPFQVFSFKKPKHNPNFLFLFGFIRVI